MTKPPPSPLHKQEPSYQSPPRPSPPSYQSPPRPSPSPLHRQELSYQSPPRPPPPPLHPQEPSQAPRPRGTPPASSSAATSSYSPYTSAPNYTSEAFDDSPAMETYAELERTKTRPGFEGGVETTHHHHQNRDNQRPNLSPRSSSFCAELSSTMSLQRLSSFFSDYFDFNNFFDILDWAF